MQNFRIDPEFQNKIPPIGADEFKQLRENILAAGVVFEPLVVWKEEQILVDGHNRWKVIQENPQITQIKYNVREISFPDKWAAFEWMYRNQLGRRNLTDGQRTYTIGKMYEARKNSIGGQGGNKNANKNESAQCSDSFEGKSDTKETAVAIGAEQGISARTVYKASNFAKGVDALREVSPAAADKVLNGKAKVTKNAVAEMALLEKDEVEAAAEKIMSDMAVPVKKPEPPKPEPSKSKPVGRTAEYREMRKIIDETIASQTDPNANPAFNLDDLIREIELNGADYVEGLRNTIACRTNLLTNDDAKQRVFRAIATVMQDITKVRGEFTK